MKKYLSILILLLLTLTLLGVVSANNTDNTVHTDKKVITKETNCDNLISKENTKQDNNKESNSNTTKVIDEGCCTTIVQGENNDSSVSFRRDTTAKATLNVKHNDTILKQYKTDGSYFCHIMISKTGWVVGTGGLEGGSTCQNIERYSLNMINNNKIITSELNKIYDIKGRGSLAHYVIKSPNGTFNLLIKRDGKILTRSGVLKPGQYVVVPNSRKYYRNGTLTSFKDNVNSMLNYSRMLSAHDAYGVQRRQILSYYYKNNIINSSITVTVSNDNGRHVGVRSAQYVDNIRTNTDYYPSNTIPVLDNYLNIGTANFFIRKAKTVLSPINITSNNTKVLLTASVKDEFGQKVNTGKVSITVDGKTLKYSNGKVIYVKVANGLVRYNFTLKNPWTKKNHTYYMNYVGNSKYDNSKSSNAYIYLDNFFILKTYHNTHIYYGSKISIKTFIMYGNNSFVNGGKVFYKINGKTLRNSKNQTLYKFVKNGRAEYNYTFNSNFRAKSYVLTTVYVNGRYRKEYKTNVTIKKIPSRIISPNITVNNKVVRFRAKVVDKYNKTIKYDSYVLVKINNKYLKSNGSAIRYNISRGIVDIRFRLPTSVNAKYIMTIVKPEFKETLSYSKNYTITV